MAQPQGPVVISNGEILLSVNPSVGRVVEFRRLDGPNLMRIPDASVLTDAKPESNSYQIYGGDQLWPAQQARWGDIGGSGGWPPLQEMDGPNWTLVDQSDSHITIQSPEGPLLGLVATRRFELSPDDPKVTIINTFERKSLPAQAADIPVNIWSVTGIVEPQVTLAGVRTDRPGQEAFTSLSSNAGDLTTVLDDGFAVLFENRAHGSGEPVSGQSSKVGTHGDWLAAVYAGDIFLQRSKYDPEGLFPDDAAVEIFSSQAVGTEYVELEVLSPAEMLQVGEKMTNVVQWHLLKRPRGIRTEELARQLAAIPEPSSAALAGCILAGVILCRSRRRGAPTP